MYEKAEYVRTAIKLFLITFALDILIILLYRYKKIILTFIRDLYQNRRLAYDLAKNDFKTKYAGSYLGIIWAYIQPIVTVLLYWFVFQVGLRSGDVDGFPFVLWLLVGLVPWFFISESITSATNSLIEYSYLVKKVVFKINILPFVKIFSALFVHLFFLLFTIVIYWIAGYQPDLYYLQIIYYLVCTIILIAGISYMTSSFILFFRDLGQIINILLQVFMWMTPIMWNYQIISPKLSWIFKLNPMYYIITGYRDTFINKIWFWEHGDLTIVFWGVVSIILIIGTVVFEKLKVHFADVL
ncbi:MAG: ABC transporter permease [Clostridiales bacterium]|nr:ABC transporter permease [Clostridiales bacterium]